MTKNDPLKREWTPLGIHVDPTKQWIFNAAFDIFRRYDVRPKTASPFPLGWHDLATIIQQEYDARLKENNDA